MYEFFIGMLADLFPPHRHSLFIFVLFSMTNGLVLLAMSSMRREQALTARIEKLEGGAR